MIKSLQAFYKQRERKRSENDLDKNVALTFMFSFENNYRLPSQWYLRNLLLYQVPRYTV